MDENNTSEFQFIKETIKERPLNKKKVITQIIMVIISALIFGAVSAGVFVAAVKKMAPPVKEDSTEVVNIPRDEEEPAVSENIPEAVGETVSADEIQTEAAAEEEETDEATEASEEASEEAEEETVKNDSPISYITQRVSLSVDDYKGLYRTLKDVAKETCRSVVTVTTITSDTDWFDNLYENSDMTSGLIVASNGKDLLILADMSSDGEDMELNVTFCDETTIPGEVKSEDPNTGLAVISVPLESIPEDTKNMIKEAKLGSSVGTGVVGIPVMALGSPLGIQGSQCFGRTTSNQRELSMTDRNVHILSTDIYGSKNATGVITNYDGQILGVISQKTSLEDAPNLLTAYAISDIKALIEKLSNNSSETYLGIYGTDVTKNISEEEGVPVGLYITRVALDSPALNAGIQSGDVITRLGTAEISSFRDYVEQMMKYQPGDDTVITVQRYSKGEYQELTFDVTFDDAADHAVIR